MAFYIKTDNGDGDIYQLDAVVSIVYEQSGKVTKYAVEAGFNVSDHYQQHPDRISFTGNISQVKFLRNGELATDLALFEKGMQNLKRTGKPFACLFSENLDIMKDCRFTRLVMERNVTTGKHSIDVSFNIEQTLTAEQAKLSTVPIAADKHKDMVEEKKGGKGTTEEPDTEKKGYLTSVFESLTS